MGISTSDWQTHLRELAYRHYDFDTIKTAVIGGDGASWVQSSFDLLGLPMVHLLDRFHVMRCLKRSFGSVLNISELSGQLFTDDFEAIAATLRSAFDKQKSSLRKQQIRTFRYLSSYQDGLVDLDKRGLKRSPFSTLGAMKGNMDKLVRQRMRGRGMS